jgi:hypothetical protein
MDRDLVARYVELFSIRHQVDCTETQRQDRIKNQKERARLAARMDEDTWRGAAVTLRSDPRFHNGG